MLLGQWIEIHMEKIEVRKKHSAKDIKILLESSSFFFFWMSNWYFRSLPCLAYLQSAKKSFCFNCYFHSLFFIVYKCYFVRSLFFSFFLCMYVSILLYPLLVCLLCWILYNFLCCLSHFNNYISMTKFDSHIFCIHIHFLFSSCFRVTVWDPNYFNLRQKET